VGGANEGNHSEAAVNNFRFLKLLDLVRRLILEKSPVKSEVAGFAVAVVLVERGKFDGSHSQKDLEVCGETDRCRGTEDISVGKLLSGKVNSGLLHNHTDNGKHANASVLELRPASIFQVRLDIRPIRHGNFEESVSNETNKTSSYAPKADAVT